MRKKIRGKSVLGGLVFICFVVGLILFLSFFYNAQVDDMSVTDEESVSINTLDVEEESVDVAGVSVNEIEEAVINEEMENILDTTENIEEDVMSEHPDRITYQPGFYFEPLSEEVKNRIYGLSYKEDCTVPYEDLRYVKVLYTNFQEDTEVGEIICNHLIAQDLVEIFHELYKNQYPIEKIRLIDDFDADDDISCAENNSSSFNYRVIGGTDTLSKHALGLAIDINPFYNPYITYPNGKERISPEGSEPYADRESGLPYMILKYDLCYNLFIERGFTWGGEWKSLKDYQHFQKELD